MLPWMTMPLGQVTGYQPTTAEVIAWVAAGGKTSGTNLQAMDALINGLTTDSIKSKITILAALTGDDITSVLLPLIGSAMTAIGGLGYSDYNAAYGLLSSATKMVSTTVTTGSNAATGEAVWLSAANSGFNTGFLFGAQGSGGPPPQRFITTSATGAQVFYDANSIPQVITFTPGSGLWHVENPASGGTGRLMTGGISRGTWTTPSIGSTPASYFGGYNNNGTATGSAEKIGFYVRTNGSMSSTDMSNLSSRIGTYISAIGRT